MGVVTRAFNLAAPTDRKNIKRSLSIVLSVDRFSFAIFSEDKQLHAAKNYSLSPSTLNTLDSGQVLDIIKNDEDLKSMFFEVFIGYDHPQSTIIPDPLFRKESLKDYLQGSNVTQMQEIAVDDVKILDAKNVYHLDEGLKSELLAYFPGAKLRHLNTVLIERLADFSQNEGAQQIYIYVHLRRMQLFYFQEGRLKYLNDFEFKAAKDFVYYVLFVFQQFNLDTEISPVYLFGTLEQQSNIYKQLYRYVRYIHWMECPSTITIPPEYNKVAANHFDFDLFALALCE